MPNLPKPPSINLLRSQEKGIFEKFLDWSLTVGRVLVLGTFAIALSMLLYRFILDRQIIDLHDEIKDQQVTLTALQSQENTYRLLQKKLSEIKQVEPLSQAMTKTVEEIINLAKGKMVFTDFSYEETTIILTGRTSSVTLLNSYLTSLKANPQIASVSLDTIKTKTGEATIIADISITLK